MPRQTADTISIKFTVGVMRKNNEQQRIMILKDDVLSTQPLSFRQLARQAI